MDQKATYQNITATVRPPRCVIFINRNSDYWKVAADCAIAKASEAWGGRYFLIVPTDGVTIEDKFWELLEVYSPDHLAVFSLTFSDLEGADPEQYNATKERYKKAWGAKEGQADGFEDWFSGSAAQSRVDEFAISDELSKELIYRLSPFHFSGAIDTHLTTRSGFGYPFTKIAKVISATTRHIGLVRLPPAIGDLAMKLLIHSEVGVVSEDHYVDAGFIAKPLAGSYDILDILKHVNGSRLTSTIEDAEPRLDDDFLLNTPFGLSMLHLGQYYRADRHMEYKEPVVVVLGDTVDDFCLYYSLSRMHEGVKWLPLEWLRASSKALNDRRKRRERGEEPREFTRDENAGRALVNLFYELIEYGHQEKRLQLCSMSLNQRQLVAYRTQFARCSYFDESEVTSNIDCLPIESISTACILRVFETNNYVNHRSMVFVDGKSVSPFETPSIKNFTEVRLSEHYWLTSLRVEGYQPPSLPELGPKIVNLHGSTTESRVAEDGIVYQCPNSMIFSNELDAVLVRPKIEMPDVMDLLNAYFADVGIAVRYSDKGKYFNDSIRRFGGLDSLGAFIKAKATRSVLEKFMQTNKNAENGVFFVRTDQRSYLDLDAITDSMGSPQHAADLVDDLLTKEIIYRGYILKCERCSLSSWYSLDALSSVFICNRCSYQQKFTQRHWKNGMVEPRWCYKLAETVYQFYEKNSHLTAQVLYRLKTQSTYAFHYAPEIDLIDFSGPGNSREMDVACILDGQIIFGECKTETLKLRDVVKFEELVRMPIKNPYRIIFASTQNVSEDFKKRMSGVPKSELMVRGDLYDD
ncbi:hypothetical protein OG478_12065 [Streptomyces phaeochromogenes]|uniref:hypothetical protein n=1 Tax=Streptomyces phaeochromogenes TaxID=1923 RepID=UPI00386515AE|nr:hypothetical protein OG478_12065 [Streptomyces phaeochromogenes]